MDATLASVIIAAFTVLGSIIGYFHLQKKLEIRKLDNAIELEDVKKENTRLIFEAEMGLISASITVLQGDLKDFKAKIQETVVSIQNAGTDQKQILKVAGLMLKALQKFSKDTEERFTWVESKFRDVDSLHMDHEVRIKKIELGRVTVVDTSLPKKG